jgi:hypothetical protein
VTVPVPVEAQIVAEVPTKVTVLVPVEAQNTGAGASGSTDGGEGAAKIDGAAVTVEAQIVAESPTKVTMLVPVEAQEHRCWCQRRHRWWRRYRRK